MLQSNDNQPVQKIKNSQSKLFKPSVNIFCQQWNSQTLVKEVSNVETTDDHHLTLPSDLHSFCLLAHSFEVVIRSCFILLTIMFLCLLCQ